MKGRFTSSSREIALRSVVTLVRGTFPEVTDPAMVRRALRAAVDAFVDALEPSGQSRDRALVALARAPRSVRSSVIMESAGGPIVAMQTDGAWIVVRPPRGPQEARTTVVVEGRTLGSVANAELLVAFS